MRTGTLGWGQLALLSHTHSPALRHARALPFHPRQLHASAPVMCLLEQADYQECLHREKLKRRIAAKAIEATARKEAPAEPHGHGH